MDRIRPGLTGESVVEVTEEIAIDFLGLDSARVLGTPFLVMLLEMTARNAIKPLLDHGYDSVGADVSIKHLAATPLGMRVTFRAEVIEVDGRRVRFRVEAEDEKEKVCEGTHERFVVNVSRFAERVKAKASAMAQPGSGQLRH
jgi:predicted thioesterase